MHSTRQAWPAWALAYGVALFVFVTVDLIWISTVVAPLYRQMLGSALADSVRLAPAVLFYLSYPLGLMIFAIEPALAERSGMTAGSRGALFGLFTYATYDLTNYATLRDWTLFMTVSDILYGGFLAGLASLLGYWAGARLAGAPATGQGGR